MNHTAVADAIPLAGIGHNHPPDRIDQIVAITSRLSDAHRDLVQRFLDLELGCARVPDPIESQEDAALVTDFIAQCQSHIRKAEAAHRREKDFFLKAGRAVDAFFKRRCEKLTAALAPTISRLKIYRDRLAEAERQRHEAALRAAEEEARLVAEAEAMHRAEADRLAREGRTAQDHRGAAEHLALAEEAAARAALATQQMTALPPPTRIQGEYGSIAFVTRSWTFEVINLDRVPREYMSLDVEVVREAITKDGIRDIPGLRIFQTEALRVRGAA